MVEYIYLPVKDSDERDELEKLVETTISCFKKCYFVDDNNNTIASASKFETLGGGISFELDDPIMDSWMHKPKIALSYKTEKFIKNVKNKPKEMVRISSINI